MSDPLTVTVASVPHREHPVAELWSGDLMCAEIHQDDAQLLIDFHPNPLGGPWQLELGQLAAALAEAKERLTSSRVPAAARR